MPLAEDKPPTYGDLEFALLLAPVSQQATSEAKSAVTNAILAVTHSLEYILTGDVQIEFEWLIHEKLRYESDAAPDVDNVIKPLLDGLCGPNGLLIDDCQVQAVTCYWVDWTREDQQLIVRVKFMPDDWLKKKDLIFIQFPKGLCFPINRNLPDDTLKTILGSVEMMLHRRDQLQAISGDYYFSKMLLPIQRFFHRTRIHNFPVLKIDEIREQMSKSV
ncbi:hypothetical protein NIES4073_25740 [Kalymmatonema gypsitolerans NIES-4073]|nr:hypothetical protein NIES4073_25740 [Scytonema sp. NIES-4073]